MKEAGYRIGNMDSTIILQRPKLSPHKGTIKANLCALLDVSTCHNRDPLAPAKAPCSPRPVHLSRPPAPVEVMSSSRCLHL